MDALPRAPASWMYFCRSRELRAAPRARTIAGARLVAFRRADGSPAILAAACSHLGADLAKGSVEGDVIRCPLHRWEYGGDGRCTNAGAGPIPATAGQRSFPVEERFGAVFVFSGPRALFPLPGFEVPAEEMVSAPSLVFTLDTPWFMVGANVFDLRHFKVAHDRALDGPPTAVEAGPFARRLQCGFRVQGSSLADRATRLLAGPDVRYDMTVWGGTIVTVQTTFARDQTFGYLCSEPLPDGGVKIHIIANARRRRGLSGVLDPLRARLKRFAIGVMMKADARALGGLVFDANGLAPGDEMLADYLRWASTLPPADMTGGGDALHLFTSSLVAAKGAH